MKRFEYKFFVYGIGEDMIASLNELGFKGWEVVSFKTYDSEVTSTTEFLLKREIKYVK